MGSRTVSWLSARRLPREPPHRHDPRPHSATSATRDRFPPETHVEARTGTPVAADPNTARKEQIPMPRDFHIDPRLAARQHLRARKTHMRGEEADQNGNGRGVRWTPTGRAALATELTSAVHCRPFRAPALGTQAGPTGHRDPHGICLRLRAVWGPEAKSPVGLSRPSGRETPGGQCRHRTPFPPETHRETLGDALTRLAPHTARTRQMPMNSDIPSDPILAARPPLGAEKPPIAIEKADQNGNRHRPPHPNPNPRRRVSQRPRQLPARHRPRFQSPADHSLADQSHPQKER
jgi:hypothetical protein